MKNKIIFVICIILLSSLAYAECPPDCPESQDKYSYDQFKEDFAEDRISAISTAKDYPQEYMRYIKENPQAVAENTFAYEAVIGQDVKYINQNKDAFKSYANTMMFKTGFTAIEGDITAFDTSTGKVKTKTTTFSFEDIDGISLRGNTNIRIDKTGRLLYDLSGKMGKRIVTVEGTVIRKGKAVGDPLTVTDGKIKFEGRYKGDIEIRLTDGNTAKLPDCADDSSCGSVEVEVAGKTPIAVPTGVLLKGKAVIVESHSLDLEKESEFQNVAGVKFGVTEKTTITEVTGDPCSFVKHTCIQDNYRFDGKGSLKVAAKKGNKIKIDAKDGTYGSIIVKRITGPRIFLDVFHEKNIYLTDSEPQYEDGAEVFGLYNKAPHGLYEEIQNHPEYTDKLQEQRSFEATVDFTLTKAEGEKVRLVFSRNKMPLSQGNLKGLKTNIGHVYTVLHDSWVGKKYSWMIYNGEHSAQAKGVVLDERIKASKNSEEIDFLLSTIDSIERLQIYLVLRVSGDLSLEQLRKIMNSFEDRERAPTSYDLKLEQMVLLRLLSSPAAFELQKEIISSLSRVESKDLARILGATRGKEDLQIAILEKAGTVSDLERSLEAVDSDELRIAILEKAGTVSDPGRALKAVDSDGLRRMIIEKTKVISVREDIGLLIMEPIEEYLSEIKKLSPEMQELAIKNIDINKGVFAPESNYKGIAFRRMIQYYEGDPKGMVKLLDRIPRRDDLKFNPEGFKTIYFDDEFQKKTKALDFANKYSVALTMARYLDQRGTWLPEDRTKAMDIILEHRNKFAKKVLLDENTYYIPVTHEEKMFHNSKMVGLARDSGVKKMADQDMKGAGSKEKFLGFVERSKNKGKTTIHFNNHGGPNHQWLSKGQVGVENSDEMRRPEAISYVELGDALVERGNLGEVTIMIDSCHSKDFTDNLYRYLHDEKGVDKMPGIITETNRGQVGWGNKFLGALEKVHKKGTPLTGADIYGVESETFFNQDLSVTIPTDTEIIELGSPNDEGAAEPPRKPVKLKEDELPPTVIEIAENEQAMEERLLVG